MTGGRSAWARCALAAALAAAAPALARADVDLARGRALYEEHCATCHGATGRGEGPTGQALRAQGMPPRNFTKGEFHFDTDRDGRTGTRTDLRAVIARGAAPFGGSPLMAPWGHLGPDAVADLAAFVRSFAAPAPPP